MKPETITIRSVSEPTEADTLHVYACDDEHVHVMMLDADNNVLTEITFEPETALSIAKRIQDAADQAMGI